MRLVERSVSVRVFLVFDKKLYDRDYLIVYIKTWEGMVIYVPLSLQVARFPT